VAAAAAAVTIATDDGDGVAAGRLGQADGHGRLSVKVGRQPGGQVQPDVGVGGPGQRRVCARQRARRPPAVQRPRAAAVQPVDPGLGHQQLVAVRRRRHHHLGAGHRYGGGGGRGGGGGGRGCSGCGGGRGRRRSVVVVVAVVLVHGVYQAADDLRQPHLASSVIVTAAHYIFFCSTHDTRAEKNKNKI